MSKQYNICSVTEIKLLSCATIQTPLISICIQQKCNGWVIEYGTILIPDNRPFHYKN